MGLAISAIPEKYSGMQISRYLQLPFLSPVLLADQYCLSNLLADGVRATLSAACLCCCADNQCMVKVQ